MLQANHSITRNPYLAQKADRRLLPQEKDQIILQHCPLVKFMALRLVSRLPNNVQTDDLFNAGIIGLIDAIEKYDPTQGIQFETYAKIRIRGAMLDEIRSMDWVPRSLRQKGHSLEKACSALEQKLGRNPTDEEIAQQLQISIGDYYVLLDEVKGISIMPEDIQDAIQENKSLRLTAPESDEPFLNMHRSELKDHLTAAIKTLPEKEQLVLSLYYYEELTMKEIGAVMGYTESRISQIHTKAVLRLRTKLGRKLKKDDLPEHINCADGGQSWKATARV
jgi:RNA polymerase sigma factor for flagellar operon FliA